MPEELEELRAPYAPAGRKSLKTPKTPKTLKSPTTPKVASVSKACQAYSLPEDDTGSFKAVWATAHAAAASIAETLKAEIEGAQRDSNFYRELLNEQEADAAREATNACAAIHALQGDVDRYKEVAKYYKDKVTRQDAMISHHMRVDREDSIVQSRVRDD